MGNFTGISCREATDISPLLAGNFDRVSADGDGVDSVLFDGTTDESDDMGMDRIFRGVGQSGISSYGIFTMNLADGQTDNRQWVLFIMLMV